MTMLQLRIAIATADLKSITAAAKLVETTQPNASNCLKLLESELGFSIFNRSNTGITVTDKGAQFLVYARQMIDLSEKTLDIHNNDDVYRLHFGTVNYYAAAEPFFNICAEHRESPNNDFYLRNVSIAEGISMLQHRTLDVVAVAVMQHQLVSLRRECKNANIEMHSICHVPAVIMMRSNHPAALDGCCINIKQGSDVMKDFPYVGLRNLSDETDRTSYNDSDFVQCSYKIFVDDTNARLRMIESTNGFGFGIMSSYKMRAQFNLVRFPVPGVSLELFCLTPSGESNQRGVKDYMTQLKNEMRLLLETT